MVRVVFIHIIDCVHTGIYDIDGLKMSFQISTGSIMNAFDRNINFDSLFKFSQMYVSSMLYGACQSFTLSDLTL